MSDLIKHQKVFILGLVILFFTQYSFGAQKEPLQWRIKDLAQAPIEKLKLRNKQERLIKTVDVKQLVFTYSIMTAIEEVAEIHAELILEEGKAPNAFATMIEDEKIIAKIEEKYGEEFGGNVVIINFAMLDLIGTDVHAAAAIIGHELAHLKLDHREDIKKAQKSNPNSIFTAANTRYSRDNEREADYLGVIWAIEAGYDPAGAVRVHEKLYKMHKLKGGGFVGSHPSSIERITILKSLVRRLSR